MTDVIKTILLYYAIICLICSPISVFTVVILYKKTTLIDRLNHWLDKVLGLEKKDDKKIENESLQEQKNETKKQESDNDKSSNVTAFAIYVGDSYYCKLNSQNAAVLSIGNTLALKWNSRNEFVGRIITKNGESIFLAEKAGETNISCAQRDDDYDTGAEIYRINVLPHNLDWFAEKTFNWVLVNSPEVNMTELLRNYKLIRTDKNKNISVYGGNESFIKQLTLQMDKYNGVLRAVYELKMPTEELQRNIFDEMNERFDEIKLYGDIRIWIHRVEDEVSNKVDMYAFFKKSVVNGNYLLAFGHSWRNDGEVEEFILNINMAERFFSDCLPDEPLSEIDASDSLEKAQRHQEEKRPAKAETVNPENGGNETTEPGPEPENNGHQEHENVIPQASSIQADDTVEKESRTELERTLEPEKADMANPEDNDIPDITSQEEDNQDDESNEDYEDVEIEEKNIDDFEDFND